MLDELVSILNRKNAEWELYWEVGRGSSFRIERGTLERSQEKFYSGIGLRIGLNGHLGFSYITGMSHDSASLERFVEETIKLARVSEVPFVGFPDEESFPKVEGLYDDRISSLSFEDASEMALDFSGMMNDKNAVLSGSLAFGVKSYGLVNSNGVELKGRSTGMSISSYAVLGTGTGSAYQLYNSLQDGEEMASIIQRSLNDARMSAEARPLEPYAGEILFEPEAFRSLIELFLENLCGDSVYFGRSRFSRPGEVVSSEALTVVDDSTRPGFPGSYPFDGEGTPGRRTVLVDGGVLRSFLLDHTYASFLDMKSTGNAVRDFRTKPHIGTSNLMVIPGEDDLSDFNGVVVKEVFGEHTANPVSGDFSLAVGLGYVVKNGERIPFRDNMLSGNVFELLSSISAVGKESERIGSFSSPGVIASARIV